IRSPGVCGWREARPFRRSRRRRLGAAAARSPIRALPRARSAGGAAGWRCPWPRVVWRLAEAGRMSQRRFGLRLRVLATLSGAAGLCGALLSVLLLLRTRDEIARSHLASARRDLRAAAAAVEERCVGDVE